MSYGSLIVCTTSQAFVYVIAQQNWASPFVFDVKDSVMMIVQGHKFFALIDASLNFNIYAYDGKLVSSPKSQGLRVEFLNKRHISISSDVLAIIDPTNPKIVRVFDIMSGKPSTQFIEHTTEICEMDLNQIDMSSERKMCFVDSNRDMFLTLVHKPEAHNICNMVDSFMWNDGNDMIACLSDGKLITWFYPNAIYVDKDLMLKSTFTKEVADLGKLAQMQSFTGNISTVRRVDGALLTIMVSPYPKVLYEHVEKADFEKAIRLCRFVKEPTLWATLGAMAIYCRELNTVEIALAAIDEADKVQFINYVKDLPSEPARNSAIALYCKKVTEAEQILLSAKLYYRAIKLNIKMYKWDRALEIAVNNKTHVDTVLLYRKRFLEQYGKEETNERFKQYSNGIELDWERVKTKINADKKREADANQ